MKNILSLLSLLTITGCSSVIQIGDLNLISTRNIPNDQTKYMLLKSYAGDSKQEKKQCKKDNIRNLESAIDKIVKNTPGGEYVKNVKVYLYNKQYIAVVGDVWGIKGEDVNFKGFKAGDFVLYKTTKGKIISLKNDKNLYFQEFGKDKIEEVEYINITKLDLTDEEYKALRYNSDEELAKASGIISKKATVNNVVFSIGEVVMFEDGLGVLKDCTVIDIDGPDIIVKMPSGKSRIFKATELSKKQARK